MVHGPGRRVCHHSGNGHGVERVSGCRLGRARIGNRDHRSVGSVRSRRRSLDVRDLSQDFASGVPQRLLLLAGVGVLVFVALELPVEALISFSFACFSYGLMFFG